MGVSWACVGVCYTMTRSFVEVGKVQVSWSCGRVVVWSCGRVVVLVLKYVSVSVSFGSYHDTSVGRMGVSCRV